MKRINTVIGGLRIALNALSNRLGVSLEIKGRTACTNGTTITLPDLPEDDDIAALLARGYVDHETAHVRCTDFSIDPTRWTNLIEDVRIEREQGKVFPGCVVNLRNLVVHLKSKGKFRGSPNHPLSLLMSWMSCRSRHDLLRQPLDDIAVEMETMSRLMFGDLFCDAFGQLINEVDACLTTADCDDLARRVQKLLNHPPKPRQDDKKNEKERKAGPGDSTSSPSPSGSSSGEREPADSSAPDDGSPSGASDPSSSLSDQDRQGDGGQNAGSSPTQKQKKAISRAARGDQDQSVKEIDLGELLRDALGKEHAEAERQGTLVYIPGTCVMPVSFEGVRSFNDARCRTSRLRAGLSGLLQSLRLQHHGSRQCGHRIEAKAVHRIACQTPETRIFSARRQKEQENTAVVILGDRSSSMEGRKIEVAIQAAFVTAESLELLPGVTCSVGLFPYGDEVAELKDFGEKPHPGRFTLDSYGGTPMAQALLWAGMKITHRKEPRKIVIVMTDGQPDDVDDTKRSMKRLNDCGIETYGIGILDSNILNWMNKARVIGDVAQLPQALMDVLKEALVNERRAA